MPDVFRLRMEKLVAGGEALAFQAGKAVFVPLALPGELVEVRLARSSRDWAKAELLEVLEPSPHRVTPPCPIYSKCGGCNLQHLDYGTQVAEKALILSEAFLRTGRMEIGALSVLPSPPFAYRNRLQIHRSPSGRPGFMRRSGNAVVEAPTCPIAVDSVRAWIEEQNLSPPAEGLGARAPDPSRFIVFGRDKELWVEGETEEAELQIGGEAIRFRVGGFFQSNLQLLECLVPRMLERLSGERAADLYCGVGVFAHFLASRFGRLSCVEEDSLSIELARRNVPGPGREFFAAAVEDWLRNPSAEERFDCILVDPPRSGLSASVRSYLVRARVPALLYLSCDPVTLARDIGELTRSGYSLESVEGLDFYPQTSHLESFARLSWR
ncbi:MAG: class I SAM-dependent RNA methyltransferase [Rectinemataceae bacterium]